MVSELVETSRLWGRTAARIDPRWVEPLAGHLLKRTLRGAALGEASARTVVATERVTLYGLPIVAGRAVAYGQIDPVLSRDLFIRRALVEGDWDTRHRFFADNAAAGRGGRGARGARAPARHPRRRPDALRLLRRARARDRRLRRALRPLVARRAPRAAGPADVHARAADQPGGGRGRRRAAGHVGARASIELALTYRFEPGSRARRRDRPRPAQDAAAAARRRASSGSSRRCAPELVDRADPLAAEGPAQAARARCPDVAAEGARAPAAAQRPLLDGARAPRSRPSAACGSRPTPGISPACPRYLKMTFSVEDEQGKVVAAGQDLAALREQVAPDAARGARGRHDEARAHRPDELDVRDDPEGRRAPRHRPDGARVPVAGRRGRDGRRCARWRARRRRRCTCAPARAGCWR